MEHCGLGRKLEELKQPIKSQVTHCLSGEQDVGQARLDRYHQAGDERYYQWSSALNSNNLLLAKLVFNLTPRSEFREMFPAAWAIELIIPA